MNSCDLGCKATPYVFYQLKTDHMKKKKIIKITAYSFGIALALFVILVAHIVAVTKPSDSTHINWQLSRIDFEKPLSESEANEVLKAIKSIEGIKNTHVNSAQGTLVYSYEAGSMSNSDVYKQFTQQISIAAKPYKAPPIEEASGCPVLDKSSLSYRFTTFVQNTFK